MISVRDETYIRLMNLSVEGYIEELVKELVELETKQTASLSIINDKHPETGRSILQEVILSDLDIDKKLAVAEKLLSFGAEINLEDVITYKYISDKYCTNDKADLENLNKIMTLFKNTQLTRLEYFKKNFVIPEMKPDNYAKINSKTSINATKKYIRQLENTVFPKMLILCKNIDKIFLNLSKRLQQTGNSTNIENFFIQYKHNIQNSLSGHGTLSVFKNISLRFLTMYTKQPALLYVGEVILCAKYSNALFDNEVNMLIDICEKAKQLCNPYNCKLINSDIKRIRNISAQVDICYKDIIARLERNISFQNILSFNDFIDKYVEKSRLQDYFISNIFQLLISKDTEKNFEINYKYESEIYHNVAAKYFFDLYESDVLKNIKTNFVSAGRLYGITDDLFNVLIEVIKKGDKKFLHRIKEINFDSSDQAPFLIQIYLYRQETINFISSAVDVVTKLRDKIIDHTSLSIRKEYLHTKKQRKQQEQTEYDRKLQIERLELRQKIQQDREALSQQQKQLQILQNQQARRKEVDSTQQLLTSKKEELKLEYFNKFLQLNKSNLEILLDISLVDKVNNITNMNLAKLVMNLDPKYAKLNLNALPRKLTFNFLGKPCTVHFRHGRDNADYVDGACITLLRNALLDIDFSPEFFKGLINKNNTNYDLSPLKEIPANKQQSTKFSLLINKEIFENIKKTISKGDEGLKSAIKMLWKINPASVIAEGEYKGFNSLVLLAFIRGAYKELSYLCNEIVNYPEININATCDLGLNTGKSALWIAAWNMEWELVEQLIEYGADVNATCKEGEDKGKSVLWLAAFYGEWEIADKLIQQGANINAICTEGKSALLIAAFNREWKIVEQLIQQGANIDAICTEGKSALLIAAFDGEWEIVDKLIQQGANINAICTEGEDKGKSALLIAAFDGEWEIVDKLIQQGANINAICTEGEDKGKSALLIAAFDGEWEIVEKLIQQGANINAICTEGVLAGISTLLIAACGGDFFGYNDGTDELVAFDIEWEIVDKLIAYGADVNAKFTSDSNINKGKTALWFAVGAEKWNTVDKLINCNADVHATCIGEGPCKGMSVLWICAYQQNWKLVNKLINYYNCIDTICSGESIYQGKSVAWLAAFYRKWKIVDKLIEYSANINAVYLDVESDWYGQSVLWLVAYAEEWELGSKLIKLGADINATSIYYNQSVLGLAKKYYIVNKDNPNALNKDIFYLLWATFSWRNKYFKYPNIAKIAELLKASEEDISTRKNVILLKKDVACINQIKDQLNHCVKIFISNSSDFSDYDYYNINCIDKFPFEIRKLLAEDYIKTCLLEYSLSRVCIDNITEKIINDICSDREKCIGSKVSFENNQHYYELVLFSSILSVLRDNSKMIDSETKRSMNENKKLENQHLFQNNFLPAYEKTKMTKECFKDLPQGKRQRLYQVAKQYGDGELSQKPGKNILTESDFIAIFNNMKM